VAKIYFSQFQEMDHGEPFSLDFGHEIYGYLSSRNSCSSAGKVFGFSSATAVLYEAGYRERCKAVAKI
jgi:hypothetical protein